MQTYMIKTQNTGSWTNHSRRLRAHLSHRRRLAAIAVLTMVPVRRTGSMNRHHSVNTI